MLVGGFQDFKGLELGYNIICSYSLGFPHFSHMKAVSVYPSYVHVCHDALSSTSEKFNIPVHRMTLGEFYHQHTKGKKSRGVEPDAQPLYVFEQVSKTDVKK